MDDQRNSLLAWPSYYCQGKNMEELAQSLLLTTTLELETTRLRAQEELRMRDDQLNQLKDLLNKAIAERDEAQNKFQTLLEKLLLQQQQTAPHSGISSIEDEPRRGLDSNNAFSSSDCEESIVSSPVIETPIQPQRPQLPPELEQESIFLLVSDRAPLPEKGKFLEAVMKAGPLLQNLLLAGPLPQWRHPPPPLDTYQIPPPPVLIPSPPPPHLLHQDSLLSIDNNYGKFNRKRGVCELSDSSTETKYQRVV